MKCRIVGLMLFASALSMVYAVSASAVVTLLAQWLVSGAAISTAKPFKAVGGFEWEDTSNKGAFIVSAGFIGTLSPDGEGSITEVLNAKEEIASLAAPILGTRPIGTTCEESATDIEMSPESLPWQSLLVLTSAGSFESYIYSAAFSVSCLILGIKITDECAITTLAAGGSGVVVANVTGGVEASGEAKPLANCSVGGSEKGRITILAGNLLTSTAGTVTVSSEG